MIIVGDASVVCIQPASGDPWLAFGNNRQLRAMCFSVLTFNVEEYRFPAIGGGCPNHPAMLGTG